MKRISFFLAICLLFAVFIPVAAREPFHYESKAFGFSITIPNLPDAEIAVETYETGVSLFHAPSQAKWGGLIGSIEVVTPRSKFFSENYTSPAYRILAMGEDEIFLWKSAGGGVNSGGEMIKPFLAAAAALSVDNLKKVLVPTNPDDQPILNTKRHLAYLTAENGLVRPDALLTRGELAEMLYALLDAVNKDKPCENLFPDIAEASCAQAANYLASYGILSGYADGTFHPNEPVSRAQFAVLLHRCQFAAPVGRYGDLPDDFTDVSADYWAEKYLYSANTLGWMTGGDADGRYHPDQKMPRADAVAALNRLLGRDESHSAVGAGQTSFSDLPASHWAYTNVLEAAGALSPFEPLVPKREALPKETGATYFLSEADGWAVSESQLRRTADAGKTWVKLGDPFAFTVSDLFFFSTQEGILLGSSKGNPCILLQTHDGGKVWSDLLATPAAQRLHFPAEQFPTEKSMLDAIISAELRPASPDAVYLTIRYHPCEIIYTLDLEAVKQTAVTARELLANAT